MGNAALKLWNASFTRSRAEAFDGSCLKIRRENIVSLLRLFSLKLVTGS